MIRTLHEVDAQRTALTREQQRLQRARSHVSDGLRELGTGTGLGGAVTNSVAYLLVRSRGKIDRRLTEIDGELRNVAAAERRVLSQQP